MKIITLTAPYSWLAAAKLKEWETRSWQTSHRGLLGIHTAKGLGPVGGALGLVELCKRPHFREAMITMGIENPLDEPLGRIIAVCELADCRLMVENQVQHENAREPAVIIGQQTERERAFGYWKVGRYAWKLTGMETLRHPIVIGGWQRLWDWGTDICPPTTGAASYV